MHTLIALVVSSVLVMGSSPPGPAPSSPDTSTAPGADGAAPAPRGSPTAERPHAPAPPQTGAGGPPSGVLFQTSDRCIGCHNRVVAPSGLDVSIGFEWRPTMMANAARDPYWQAGVRREIMDHPEARAAIEDKCATCHMPMARYQAHLNGGTGRVFANLPVSPRPGDPAADGVSCSTCHQIEPDNLGEPGSFTGGFEVDEASGWGARRVYGPFEPAPGRAGVMSSATGFQPTRAAHIQQSELCATCHTLYTHALNEEGEEVGELPEQMPYLEWLESDYPDERGCPSCHMPVVEDPVPVTGVLGVPRDSVSRHVFRGGNFFMLRLLNRYRNELGVTALPQELDAAANRTVAHLRDRAARLDVDEARRVDGALEFDVAVTNLAGHKLPSAYPSRRAWLHVTVRDARGTVVFESGALRPDGSVVGNDNDADGSTFEPHHTVIEREDQVQIWEAIMVDDADRVTTGLLFGVRYVKDNRILPRGFEKGRADPDVAVHGAARADRDFAGGGDRVRYRVPVDASDGPFRVTAELWYQPIAFRWARNLAGYDAMEPQRFVKYYDAMAEVSALKLTEATGTAR